MNPKTALNTQFCPIVLTRSKRSIRSELLTPSGRLPTYTRVDPYLDILVCI